GDHPLQPLEEEIILVQSNGIGEWIKASFATLSGICAATRVELPGRFLWRIYRAVLGKEIPQFSPLDKSILTWRLMRLLPTQLARPEFAALAHFLGDGDPDRLLQLAMRLADLYDQYQIYRDDWLDAWEQGNSILTDPSGMQEPLSAEHVWQSLLWQTVCQELDASARAMVRPHVHRKVLARLQTGSSKLPTLPRRVIVFGATALPRSTLDILIALSSYAQIILAVPNPCRYYWADIMAGRELFHAERRRHPFRYGQNLSAVSLEAMHAHAHPLLAAWGRQGRDFVRLLDSIDDSYPSLDFPRIDLFDESPGVTLLEQVQAAIRDLLPLPEHPRNAVDAKDRSIVFHVAHSRQREVEILHDELLKMLQESDGQLRPRDIVVMVPDIATFAPAIRAAFGQYGRNDPRFLPFAIVDQQKRNHAPVLIACEWLLKIDQHRIGITEILDLLDVPAVAKRFGLDPQDLPQLRRWVVGAGVRWGLHRAQRESLGLTSCGEQNSWLFGLQRMLLGYASGTTGDYQEIQPYAEIGGLEAALVGKLDQVFQRLQEWWEEARTLATPEHWVVRARNFLSNWFLPQDAQEQQVLTLLEEALHSWAEACEHAGFHDPIPLSVFREGWLADIDEPQRMGRFLSGGVTFCSLMPLRSIPFEVVCLLGMNDGDYPRSVQQNDFDLMRLPGQYRPGDRSRRDDDRYLLLEALLSARKTFYVSWSGRSPRDNSSQAPSVLISQLRDYLAAGWTAPVGQDAGNLLQMLTTEHPLQPFSRRYFEAGGLLTYAREWRDAHESIGTSQNLSLPPAEDSSVDLTLTDLAGFLKNPVRTFFRRRLGVYFEDPADVPDDELFHLDGLDLYVILQDLLREVAWLPQIDMFRAVAELVQQMQRSGQLPMGGIGDKEVQRLEELALPMLLAWQDATHRYPHAVEKVPLRFSHAGFVLQDWLESRYGREGEVCWIGMTPSTLLKEKKVRPEKLVDAWVRLLA
ncbi:MAG: exodeoxyribonuclease V subunit gamma, partial [Acidithiobacillus sp.]|nr:exodeoxyribonuclease V subunit gamma [Acidithiobacillus sp.]